MRYYSALFYKMPKETIFSFLPYSLYVFQQLFIKIVLNSIVNYTPLLSSKQYLVIVSLLIFGPVNSRLRLLFYIIYYTR